MRNKKVISVYDREGWAVQRLWETISMGITGYDIQVAHFKQSKLLHVVDTDILVLNWTGDSKYLRSKRSTLDKLPVAQLLHSCIYEHDVRDAIDKADIVASVSERVSNKHGANSRYIIPSAAHPNFIKFDIKLRNGVLKVGSVGSKRNPTKNWEAIRRLASSVGELVTDNENLSLEDMVRLYNTMDVYLCLSSSEGSNVCIAEAIACGLPIITTRVGSAEFHVQEGFNGYIVDDEAQALEALRKLDNDRELLNTMSNNSLAMANRYTYKDMAGRAKEWLDAMPPYVTVIIPCYNYAKYLPDAAHSVIRQNYVDWEIIIVNDGSTDDTAQVAEELVKLDDRIRFVNLKKNRGLSEARNAGIKRTNSPYFLPLDADDELANADALGSLVYHQRRFEEQVITYGDIQVYGDHEKLLTMPPYSLQKLMSKNIIPYCSLYPKCGWIRTSGYKKRMSDLGGWEDYEFNINMGKLGYYGRKVDHTVLKYRRHGRSMLHGAEDNKDALREALWDIHSDMYKMAETGELDRLMHNSSTIIVEYTGIMKGSFSVRGTKVYKVRRGVPFAVNAEDMRLFSSEDWKIHENGMVHTRYIPKKRRRKG